ncbi:P-loop containing nucleoside triphosphate hydrolase protein [Flammula alnicola]|nr:P-loop containing nucleoside triphosphate hydrolase protein [Flammula alnicola]
MAANDQRSARLNRLLDTVLKGASNQDPQRGQFLTRILNAIVESSSFWMAFTAAFKERKLTEAGHKCFAWALLHLIQIPTETVSPHLTLAKEVEPLLLGSPYIDVRNLGQKIKHTISVSSSSPSTTTAQDDITPGGRHDNDFLEFRDIAILPTADELASTEAPFLRPSAALDDPHTEENREALYLDNQFRLLREDMIYEMREELQMLWVLKGQKASRLAESHPRFLKHQSLTSLIVDGEVLAFPTIRREEDLLVKSKPQIVLELEGEMAIQKLLLRMESATHVKLIQIDVAVFAYEPVLNALKGMKVLPLSTELLYWKEGSAPGQLTLPRKLKVVVDYMKALRGVDIGTLVGLKKSSGSTPLRKDLSSMVHPDLLDVGISSTSMVRIGGKSTTRTEPMLIRNQKTDFRFSRGDHAIINEKKAEIETRATSLTSAFKRYLQSSTGDAVLMSYLEFEEEDFYSAFKEVQREGRIYSEEQEDHRMHDDCGSKYTRNIHEAAPDVVLVEEAGEILESHVITALGHAAKQLILIGDHKQLRPKVNNYKLTVEKGEGYDLNMMLPKQGPPDFAGAGQIIFINHDHPEDELLNVADMRDMGSKSSKQNLYEARMVLKIVRYLAQQGYGTDKMVVLTPYLGQLRKLQDELKTENDPVSTILIHNYQGEESDIVIASLTRSNASNDIGFMTAPERLNVLLSRARNGIIMIGDSNTFTKSKKGGALWQKFFAHIQGHVYDGFPVKCEQHPQRKALLSSEVQFEQHCPDVGGLGLWASQVPFKMSSIIRPFKMRCEEIIPMTCPKGHYQSKKCFEPSFRGARNATGKPRCGAERQKEFARQQKRDEEEAEHLRKKKEIDEQVAEQQQLRRDAQLKDERENEIRQKLADLEEMKSMDHLPGPSSSMNMPSSQVPDPSFSAPSGALPTEYGSDPRSSATGASFDKDRYNVTLLGNPGTGKTTVARHYAKFLASVRVLPGNAFEETTGSRLADDGVKGAKALLEKVINAGGGAIFVDEAYQLASQHNFQGSQVLDFLLAEMENNVGKVVFILAGYNKQMEKFFEHNPGLTSRKMIHRKYGGRMKVEDGIHGLYGRGRGRDGFGNARALENLLATISQELEEAPDTHGLPSVKRSIQDLYDMILGNYTRELKEQEPLAVSLNRAFIGSPGTGKTTVAKLYGSILADLGLLSNEEVVTKNPADFIGNALGVSESNTKAILANTIGKVLIIDEAYMLYGAGATGQQNDPYKTARYKAHLARTVVFFSWIRKGNERNVSGLSRRFAIEDAFMFEDFSSDELLEILNLKLAQQNLDATLKPRRSHWKSLNDPVKKRPNFGNGGEVENLLSNAKKNYTTRNRGKSDAFDAIVFQPVDFDPKFDRAHHAGDKLAELFKDVVGCDEIVKKLRTFQKTALSAARRGESVGDLVPTTFVFKGPPGTGKTTTARKMGEVYFDMGLLAQATVHDCSASDIVAQYVGQTGPLVRKTFEKALGQVLFIDEAYRLKDGPFAKEATDEIVSLLTDEHYKGKIIVILAGYDNDINELLAVNRGLSSRFTEEVIFVNLRPEECLQILEKEMQKKNVSLPGLEDRSSALSCALSKIFVDFSSLESWGNARDVLTLAKKLVGLALQEDDGTGGKDSSLILDPTKAIQAAQDMLSTRSERQPSTTLQQPFNLNNPLFAPSPPLTATPLVTKTAVKSNIAQPPPKQQLKTPESAEDARDDGVSDAVWSELQMAKAASALEEKRVKDEIAANERAVREAAEREQAERLQLEALELSLALEKDRAKQEELKRQREAQRLKEIAAQRQREQLEAALKARREADATARKQEVQVQAKLRQMGVCVAGYRWINVGSGYRCAGGSTLSVTGSLVSRAK